MIYKTIDEKKLFALFWEIMEIWQSSGQIFSEFGNNVYCKARVLDDLFLCDLRSDQIISWEMSQIPIRSYVRNVSQIRSMI